MSYLHQTTRGIFEQIQRSLLEEEYVPLLKSENIKEKRFKELKENIARTKYPKTLIDASILKDKEIPLEVLRQLETTKNEEIIPFAMTYNHKDQNIFPIIKQKLITFSILNQCLTFFRRRNLLNL